MRAFYILSFLLWLTGPLAAQWHLGLEWSASQYRGGARDTSATHVASEGRPGGGAGLGARVARTWRHVGVALRASYATPGFTVAGEALTVSDKSTGRLFELATLVSTRVGGIGPSGAARVELGPALLLWDFDGEIRARVGAIGAAAYEWPVVGRLSGAARLEALVSPSWFDAAELPPEFQRRLTWRYGVTLGLRYRL